MKSIYSMLKDEKGEYIPILIVIQLIAIPFIVYFREDISNWIQILTSNHK